MYYYFSKIKYKEYCVRYNLDDKSKIEVLKYSIKRMWNDGKGNER